MVEHKKIIHERQATAICNEKLAMQVNKINGRRWNGVRINYRIQVLLRILASFIGGYVLTGYITAVTALLLPMTRVDAVILSSMLSYLWFAVILIWAFAIKSLLYLYLIVAVLIGISATLYFALQSGMAGQV